MTRRTVTPRRPTHPFTADPGVDDWRGRPLCTWRPAATNPYPPATRPQTRTPPRSKHAGSARKENPMREPAAHDLKLFDVLREVAAERGLQDAKWGEQNHPDGTGRDGDAEMARLDRAKCKANGPDEDNWRDILQEEVSEAFAETDRAKLRDELLQVAAVSVAWMQAIDRRSADA